MFTMILHFGSELEVLALLYCSYPKLDCGRKQIANRSVLPIPSHKKYAIIRIFERIKWEKSEFRANEKQIECANWGSPLRPHIFDRGSHF